MTLFEQLTELYPPISAQQAAELREFLIIACDRAQQDENFFEIGILQLKDDVIDLGFDWDGLVATVGYVAAGSLPPEAMQALESQWTISLSCNRSLADLNQILLTSFDEFSSVLRSLAEESLEESSNLNAVAGGTSTWRRDPSRSRSQKEKAIGIDAAEVVVGAAVGAGIGYLGYKAAKNCMTPDLPEYRPIGPDQDYRPIGPSFNAPDSGLIDRDRGYDPNNALEYSSNPDIRRDYRLANRMSDDPLDQPNEDNRNLFSDSFERENYMHSGELKYELDSERRTFSDEISDGLRDGERAADSDIGAFAQGEEDAMSEF